MNSQQYRRSLKQGQMTALPLRKVVWQGHLVTAIYSGISSSSPCSNALHLLGTELSLPSVVACCSESQVHSRMA